MNRGGNIGVRYPVACALHSHGMKPNFVPTYRLYAWPATGAIWPAALKSHANSLSHRM